jgi:hypothetical protein
MVIHVIRINFIYGLVDEVVSILDCVVSNDAMIMNSEFGIRMEAGMA